MDNVKYEFSSAIVGKLQYLKDGGLIVDNATINKTFTAQTMQQINKEYKGANRIHKPIALLFWIDCKNGNYSNWVKN